MRKRNHCFAIRIHLSSLFFGCIDSLVSDNVTSTAPATKAAGAPKLAVLVSGWEGCIRDIVGQMCVCVCVWLHVRIGVFAGNTTDTCT